MNKPHGSITSLIFQICIGVSLLIVGFSFFSEFGLMTLPFILISLFFTIMPIVSLIRMIIFKKKTKGKTVYTYENTITPEQNLSITEKLKELNRLYDSGLISKEEFENKRNDILNGL